MSSRLQPIPLFFWRSATGREPVRDWLREMDKRDRMKIGFDLRALQFGWPVGMPLAES